MAVIDQILSLNVPIGLIIFIVFTVSMITVIILYKVMKRKINLFKILFSDESERRRNAEEKLEAAESERNKIKKIFEKYFDESLVKNALQESLKEGMHNASFLFTDLRGYTKLSENPRAAKMVLDPYFSIISEAAHNYGGIVSQLVGDSVEVMFNIPEKQKDFVYASVKAGMKIKKEVDRFNSIKPKEFPAIRCGIGIDCGDVYLSTVGDAVQRYQPIGDSVTIADRLSKIVSNRILITKRVYDRVWERVLVKKMPSLDIKGKMVEIFEVFEVFDSI